MGEIFRYKYLPIDDSFEEPFETKGSLSIIKDGTIKFAHAKDFNDPFDCYPEVDIKEFDQSFDKNGFYIELGNKLGLSPGQRILEKPKQKKKLERGFYSQLSEIMNNHFGICCLSKNPLNLLMWAHYATRHTGFVIEFSIPVNSTSSDDLQCLVPFPVEYKKEKPIMVNQKSLKEYALTKGKDWEYEQEERVIDFDRKAGVHPYDRKQILKSVIAGMRMDDKHFDVLKNTVDAVNSELEIDVTVHKTKPSQGEFALIVPDRDDLNIHNLPR